MNIVFKANTKVSPNFSVKELIKSNTATARGIDNTPNAEQLVVLIMMANDVLQPIRAAFGTLKVNSGYRGEKLNSAIGGARRSDHMIAAPYTNCAVDIDDDYLVKHGLCNADIVKWLIDNPDIPIYKMIWEFTTTTNGRKSPKWIHISYSTDPKLRNARYFYEAAKVGGRTKYLPFDRDKFGI